MSDEIRDGSENPGEPLGSRDLDTPGLESGPEPAPAQPQLPAQPQSTDFLPGLAAISFYIGLLAVVSIMGVVNGVLRITYLLFSAFLITAAFGLLLRLRWAWAMALAAVVLLVSLFMWKFTHGYQYRYLVQGLLNLVFFLYLIRPEVRSKLR
jgi:hypothetical protein